MFRHTYCAARLQTLDGAAPVSPYTVRREMGHGSQAMVDKVYSHLGAARHRSPVVEYRVEQHVSILRDRLTAMQAGAAPGRVPGRTVPRTVPDAGRTLRGAVREVVEVVGGRAGAAPRGL